MLTYSSDNMIVNDGLRYDVAISFLVEDLSLAQALRDKLSEGLEVFFYPHTQEELSGTNGLESMRKPFLNSRVNVVMYRERWGNTPWTGVEAAAILDSCLKNAFRNLFFFIVVPSSVLPEWLPNTHIRFNYGDFTLDQAVGAIKLRVQERGGHYEPMTPLKKAELLRAEELYQLDRSQMKSYLGVEKILQNVEELFAEIERQCEGVNASGNLQIEWEINQKQSCILRYRSVGMIVIWQQQYRNVIDNSYLWVTEYNGRLMFNRDMGRVAQLHKPEEVHKTQYEPEVSRAREYGWKPAGKSSVFFSSNGLAEKCVLEFMGLIERSANDNLPNRVGRTRSSFRL